MKPRFKTTIGSKRDRETMAAAQSSSGLVLSSDISMSFQDELAATIHGAFEVAVEIAVREVSKLVGQAFGDVRDQMHETLRENKSLKLRLESAEKELDSARLCAAGDGQVPLSVSHSSQPDSPHNNDRLKAENHVRNSEDLAKTSVSVSVKKKCDYLIVEAEASCERLDGTFSEICEDGRVCSQTLNPTPSEELVPVAIMEKADMKQHSLAPCLPNEKMVDHYDQSDPHEEDVSYESSAEVQVKEEKPDLGRASGSVSGSDSQLGFDDVGEGPDDGFSLAQSKMLEDWRPDPLGLPGCEANTLSQDGSHALAHPMAVTMQATEMSSSSVGTLPVFPGMYQPSDPVPLPLAVPQNYSVPVRPNLPALPPSYKQHVCKICSRPFQRPSDLRRHQSQHHRSKPANSAGPRPGGRPPKQQKFPPGRSPYHCGECGRDFNRMENLKTHLRIHTGERPYTCSACGVRFRHSGALTRHFRIHTGEKPYVCSQCGMSFRNSGGLRFHQRLHNRQTQAVMGQ
ncbi:zinc finger protein 316-like isoform X1 [Alosa sapidissima]|uniref:zinc finger protein 316-like isoform X1 n=1 Tax=Alosa sapidissima TaxID=34773 RepID=UPI001C08D2AD|nr:zinc finger protein 316-like isoform X1 [Alosa sapidissima]